MKHTILVTQQCNFACRYCYVSKRRRTISRRVARQMVAFIFANMPPNEKTTIRLSGGEPLLVFETLMYLVQRIRNHPRFREDRTELVLLTNGSLLNPKMIDFIIANHIRLEISCDGLPATHNRYRQFPSGRGTAMFVEKSIQRALQCQVPVSTNTLITPETLDEVPQSISYLANLGVDQINLAMGHGCDWGNDDITRLFDAYNQIGALYHYRHESGQPLGINLIDEKIRVILQGGYPLAGKKAKLPNEFAFLPNGEIYPCEQLAATGSRSCCIGDVDQGIYAADIAKDCRAHIHRACTSCGLQNYCSHRESRASRFSSGFRNSVNAFQCAAERAAIQIAFEAFQAMGQGFQAPMGAYGPGMPAPGMG